ncbi:MAG: energy-coupling factor ABC transporter permease [Microthrixaceae bacterium]
MHIPDGLIDGPASAGAAAVAATGVAVATRRVGTELQERQAPMVGLVAAFVFALQMLNFPIGAGTSGHLMGGALAAVLVGPAAAVVALTVVLGAQALLFADGGLTALGLNTVNVALVGVIGGYVVFLAVRSLLPRTDAGVATAAGVGAWAGTVLGSLAFVVEYAVGGNGGAPVAAVAWAMVTTHALIGVGEGLITSAVVGSVLRARPDLVAGAHLRSATVSSVPAAPQLVTEGAP